MSVTAWILVGIATVGGWVLGWLACAFVQRAIAMENEQFRGALRYLRGAIARHAELRILTRYIDNLLSDEAGA